MGTLSSMFPTLFRLSVKKDSSVNECFEVRSGYIVWGGLFQEESSAIGGGLL